VVIYGVVVLQKGTSQDVDPVSGLVLMLENSKDTRIVKAERFAIKQISLRFNTEILKRAKFQLQRADCLSDIRARSIFHVTIPSVFAIHSSYFILPEAG